MFFRRKKEKKENVQELPKKQPFNSKGLDKLIAYIKFFCGVNLEPKQEVLEKRLMIFCESKEIYSFEELLQKSKVDNNLLQDLINQITVNETYFYRELPQLEESIGFVRGLRQNTRILSAPCASGEEVYSLAILAMEKNIISSQIEIIGIDINSEAINNAKKAIYSTRSLHRLDEKTKNWYFSKVDDKYTIKKERLPNIKFEVVNIFDDDFMKLGKFDIIFSRNMMIYFDDNFKEKTIKRFFELLAPHGRLYTGHADLVPQTPFFTKVLKDGLYFYKKEEFS